MSLSPETLTGLVRWATGQGTGLSSNVIARAASGVCADDSSWNYPHDPADFGRCAYLLSLIPEIKEPAFEVLSANGGVVWAALIARWDEIETCMKKEVGLRWEKGRSAHETYDLMRGIIAKARGEAS